MKALDNPIMYINTPLGSMRLEANGNAIVAVQFEDEAFPETETENSVLLLAAKELRSYFRGELKNFTVPVVM